MFDNGYKAIAHTYVMVDGVGALTENVVVVGVHVGVDLLLIN